MSFVYLLIVLLGAILVSAWLNNRVLSSESWRVMERNMQSFRPAPYFRANYERNYDGLVIGAETATDLTSCDSQKILNYGVPGCTLSVQREVLDYYHSYLTKGGKVIISLSPLSYVCKQDFKYYARFIRRIPKKYKSIYGDYYTEYCWLLPFPPKMSSVNRIKTRLYVRYPFFIDPIGCIRILLRGGDTDDYQTIIDMISARKIEELNHIIEFCREREYKPFVLITPLPDSLVASHAGIGIRQFGKQLSARLNANVPVLDYLDNRNWECDNMFDGIVLKSEYKQAFTKDVLAAVNATLS